MSAYLIVVYDIVLGNLRAFEQNIQFAGDQAFLKNLQQLLSDSEDKL